MKQLPLQINYFCPKLSLGCFISEALKLQHCFPDLTWVSSSIRQNYVRGSISTGRARMPTWDRALITALYTGSKLVTLLSAACWISCSHFFLAELCKLLVWLCSTFCSTLCSTLVVRNLTKLSKVSSSLPGDVAAINSRKVCSAFGDSFPTLLSCGYREQSCSLAGRKKNIENKTRKI